MLGETVAPTIEKLWVKQEKQSTICTVEDCSDRIRKSWEILWCLNWNMKDKGLPSSIKREIVLGRKNRWRKEQKEAQNACGILGVSKITQRTFKCLWN